MQPIWNIKSRAHECSRTGRAFEEGEKFYTAIYFDTDSGEFLRRDVALDAWKEEVAERKPFSYWKAEYVKPESLKPKAEITSRESAESLLRRFVEEDDELTEHARYILALMLERKKQLVPKEVKETERGKTIFYEHKKSGEVFIIRDPELRLDELGTVQDEVAMLLGFGGPAAEAAAAVGMKFTPDGKVVKADAPDTPPPAPAPTPDPVAEEPPTAVEETTAAEVESPEESLEEEPAAESEESDTEEEADSTEDAGEMEENISSEDAEAEGETPPEKPHE